MQLHLGGHLSWYDPQKRSQLEVPLVERISLVALLQQLGVPSAEIAVVVLNGKVVPLGDAFVSDSDRVKLFPPVGGGAIELRVAERESSRRARCSQKHSAMAQTMAAVR